MTSLARAVSIFGLAVLVAGCPKNETDTDTDTDTDPGTEAVAFDTGIELFGVTGNCVVAYSDTDPEEMIGCDGQTRVYDIVIGGPWDYAPGDVLCEYVYPAAGAPYATTQSGLDSNNEPIEVTCEGCTFGFNFVHDTPTTVKGGIENGAYCDVWDYPQEWETGFQEIGLAFYPDFDDGQGNVQDVFFRFYDGSGEAKYDPNGDGNYVEYAAQWFLAGTASLDETTGDFTWDMPIGGYIVYELAYYQ